MSKLDFAVKTAGHVGWARLQAGFSSELIGKQVICLGIPDEYGFMDWTRSLSIC
ncbi:hypothetical protein [Paenibacillus sp. ATY16]|uniref:hypothetical protein n=1 Tax=Paenibacillus sp. ATY16 TaxID=1759312 RepID=UPI0032C42399